MYKIGNSWEQAVGHSEPHSVFRGDMGGKETQ